MHSSFIMANSNNNSMDLSMPEPMELSEHDFDCTCAQCRELENAMAFYACPRGCNCQDCKFYLLEMKKNIPLPVPNAPKKPHLESQCKPQAKRRRLDFSTTDTHDIENATELLQNTHIDFETAMEMFLSEDEIM